jgi:hypothetical protein
MPGLALMPYPAGLRGHAPPPLRSLGTYPE